MRSRFAVVAFAIPLATALLATSPARADAHADAAKQFEEGRKLREKDPEKALAAFKQSIALEPSIGAYFNVASIHEQLGHFREAADAYRKSGDLARERGDAREKDAATALGTLLDTHSFIVLKVEDNVASAPGLKISLDGEIVPKEQYGGEVFRSPSTHEVVITATGRKDLKLTAGNRQTIYAQLGESLGSSSPPPPPPPPPETTSGGGWGWQKWTGAGLGAAGLVTAGIGGLMALSWSNTQSEINDDFEMCKRTHVNNDGKMSCPRSAANALNLEGRADDNKALSVRAWVLTGVGGALLVTGIYLFVTAPSGASSGTPTTGGVRVIPQVGTAQNGLSVAGTF